MASACFVVNEWLLDDLLLQNGAKAREQSYAFLLKLLEKCDRIVVRVPSPWRDKAHRLGKLDPRSKYAKMLFGAILKNTQKCHLMYAEEIQPLPQDVRAAIHRKDIYLVETFYSVRSSVLITKDPDLCEALSRHQTDGKMAVRLRDEFLVEYLGQ